MAIGQETERPAKRLLTVSADVEWLRWLQRLADSERSPVAVVVDRAVRDFATKRHFEPPPRR